MLKVNNNDIFHKNIKTYFIPCSSVSIFDFEQVNIRWEDKSYFLHEGNHMKNIKFILTSLHLLQ